MKRIFTAIILFSLILIFNTAHAQQGAGVFTVASGNCSSILSPVVNNTICITPSGVFVWNGSSYATIANGVFPLTANVSGAGHQITDLGGLASTGPTGITGTQTNGADQISGVNVNGVINVTTYGAKGDCTATGSTTGCTDNYSAITAAIAAASAAHKAIFFPVGSVNPSIYYTSQAINPDGVSIYGPPGAGIGNGQVFPTSVGIRGAPGNDIFESTTSGFGFVIQDVGLVVDDSINASANFPNRLPGKNCYDVTATDGSATITTSTQMCNFNQGDVGQNVTLSNGTDTLSTTIASVSSPTAATLAASWAYATDATAHLYVSIMSMPTTTTVGNCAFGFDQADGSTSVFGPVQAVFKNIIITTTSSSPQNDTCGFFFQGDNQPYATRFNNLHIRSQWGILGVPSVVNPAWGGWGDLNEFNNIIFDTTWPAAIYDGGRTRWDGGQINSALFGPQILQGGSTNEGVPENWAVANVELESPSTGSPAGGWRVEGLDNQISSTELSTTLATPVQWDATSSSCVGCIAVAGINLTGRLNQLQLVDQTDSVSVSDTGFGNLCSLGRQFNPMNGQQTPLFRSCGAVNSRQQHAFAHTGDFIANGDELTPYNNQADLWIWPADLDSGSGASGNLQITNDLTSESGSYAPIPAGGWYGSSLNNQAIVVGPNDHGPSVPATLTYVCAKMKAPTGTESVTFSINSPPSTQLGYVGAALTTTYGTFCFYANFTGLAGDGVQLLWNSSTVGADVAWVSIHPIPDYLQTTGTLTLGSASTVVSNATGTLKASALDNGAWGAPGAIGGTTPNTGAFSALTANDLGFSPLAVTISGATTLSFNVNSLIQATLAASATLTIGPLDNSIGILDVAENSTGGFTPTFAAASGNTLVWSGGTTPTPNTGASVHNIYLFYPGAGTDVIVGQMLSAGATAASTSYCTGPDVTLSSGAGTFSNSCITTSTFCLCRDTTTNSDSCITANPVAGSVGLSGTGSDVIQVACWNVP